MKSFSENAESKKQIEKNRREVAINTAEEIFKKSLHIYPAAHNAVVTLTQPSAPGTQMTPLASATLTLPSVSTSSNHPPASATPTQQLASVIPTQTLAPVTPTQALASAIPTQPLASTTQPHPPEITTQTHPLAPVTPTQPIAPDTLTQSLATVTPTNPLAHGTQTQPQAPAVQTQSQTPATLTHPSVSTTLSVTPTYPLAYITSTHPLTPVTTTVPSSPAAPIYPRAPVTPTQPLAPFSKSYSNLNSPSTPKSTMPLQEIDLPVNTRHSTPKAAEYSFLGDLSQITPIQNQNISQSPQYLETSTASAALAALRDDCYDCQMKDRDLSSMREYCCGLENDLQYLRSEVSRLQQELGTYYSLNFFDITIERWL